MAVIIFVSFICSSVMAILHDNQEVVALCQPMFRDCSYKPESSYCIHCFCMMLAITIVGSVGF